MPVFDDLCNAQTETELFVLLCSLTRTPSYSKLKGELASVQRGDKLALELTIRQGLRERIGPGQVNLMWVATHVFTLPTTDPLVWQMKDQPELIGLEAIRARLHQLRAAFDSLLPAEDDRSEYTSL